MEEDGTLSKLIIVELAVLSPAMGKGRGFVSVAVIREGIGLFLDMMDEIAAPVVGVAPLVPPLNVDALLLPPTPVLALRCVPRWRAPVLY